MPCAPHKSALVLALALALPASVQAQTDKATHPTKALLWSLLPGGGHFYLGETGTGLGYALSTGAFLLAGAEVQRRNEALGREDEDNAPQIFGEKLWELSFFTAYRNAVAADGTDVRAEGLDDASISSLIAAPFRPAQLFDPWVLGAGLLGGALAAIDARDAERDLGDVSRVGILGHDYNRDDGTALYALSAVSISLGAGFGEEALFRGLLQTMLQERWGRTPGLWAASGVFGLAHIVGPDGKPNPGAVASATLAGAYLGWLYNRDGNRLARPIAAHFWYNFMLMGTSWALDPDDNPLGVEVQFEF